MKYGFLVLLLFCITAEVSADKLQYSEIAGILDSCRHEKNTPFVKSSNHTGHYLVGKSNGRFIIKLNIQLRYPAYFSAQDVIKARQIFEETRRWITRYYLNYGLHLNIQFEHTAFNPLSSNPHAMPAHPSYVVYIRHRTGSHMKALYWGVNPEWDVQKRAIVIAHEFSHLLHLKDEYLIATGAQSIDEEAGYEDDSLMKDVDHPHPRLYPRHIKQILAPLCSSPDTILAHQSHR